MRRKGFEKRLVEQLVIASVGLIYSVYCWGYEVKSSGPKVDFLTERFSDRKISVTERFQ
jgi:hypothetical protein